ncbi:hypothetical protein KTAU_24170 [Thermogemmatispora aurantia]|uniref:Peptidase M50 n=1 Tax=Thermogemmatispora aurantia TaxID=2045279 RepID=A0A5J4KAU4_9CHLR|nr:hypothetical protein [Thermogemmatispora aurantia]GER83780.1 hypothetical protein KTAU_24170 [Thermogemmatispora aurantia]
MSTHVGGAPEMLSACYPKARDDLGVWPLGAETGSRWCLGSAEVDRYVQIPRRFCQAALTIVGLLDGTRTLEQVEDEVGRLFPGVTPGHVQRLYSLLLSNGLLLSPTPARLAQSEVRQLSIEIGSLPLGRLAAGLRPVLKAPIWWLLNAIGLGLVIWAVAMLWLHPELLSLHVVQLADSYTLGFLLSLALSGFVVLWHEIAHGLAAIRYGLLPRALHLMLYAGLAPLVYLETHGLYTIPRRRRLAIWLAGPWGNLCAAAALVVVLATFPLPLLTRQLLWKLVLVNLLFVVTNLSPFMPTDGYFILCNLLGQFHLRTRLWRQLCAFIGERQRGTVRLGLLAWGYVLVSLLTMLAAAGYWLWWLWNVCLELTGRAPGSPLVHWLAGLACPLAFGLLVALISWRRRQLLARTRASS